MLHIVLRLRIKRSSVAPSLDGSAIDEHDRPNGLTVLLLFEGGAEAVYTGIDIEEEITGAVGDRVPVG